MKRFFFRLLPLLMLLWCMQGPVSAKRVLKVLAIGNSFSEDAVEQNLYELAHAQGDSLVIGNAYIGGCSIDRHWDNALTGKRDYAYRKVIGGRKAERKPAALEEIIRDEDWDIITLQQASHYSGQIATYQHLSELKNYVSRTARKKNVHFAFHMTWAYAQDSNHSGFKNYGNSQQKMYQSIVRSVTEATRHAGIKKVIPSGVAIQEARSLLGDRLCRDGYHLSLGLGRYTAACTWCEFLTRRSVVGNGYRPESLSPSETAAAQAAAHKAMKTKLRKLR